MRVSRDLQRVSVRADQVPRGRLLAQIAARLGVEIRAYDVDLAAPISISVVDAPLDVVVTRVLPTDARYVIRYGDRDVAASTIRSGPKRGEPVVRPRGAPNKGATRPYVRNPRSVVKRAARTAAPLEPRQTGAGIKAPSAQTLAVPAGTGPKRPLQPAQGDSSLRLTVTVTAAGAVRIVAAQRVLGERAASDVVRGTLLYVVRGSGGSILHYGTMLDPLAQHSYLPGDVRHDQQRAAEGTVNIPIPGRLSDRAQLASLVLELYDARDAQLPQHLDQEALTRVLRAARAYQRMALEQAIPLLNR